MGRDEYGVFLGGMCQLLHDIPNVITAELRAILASLHFAADVGFCSLEVESDSPRAVQLLLSSKGSPHQQGRILEGIWGPCSMAHAQHKRLPEQQTEAPIHGDILEAILSHVPLIDLVPACHVSKAWNRAVSSSLGHGNPIKPWLLVRTQSNRASHVTTAHAYDPRSHVWIEIREPSIKHVSAIRSSHSTLLYMLSPTKFAFSFDPLHLTWHNADAPRVWRTDPIVALVGRRIVVAGGACEFEDDPLAVEMYDVESRTWYTCQSMPEILKDSTASTWLSVAVHEHRMHVTEKNSGVTYSFDPNTKTWHGPYDLRPDQSVYSCVTGILHDRLIIAGLVGDAENVKRVKLWEVRGELNSDSKCLCEEMDEMPKELVMKLRGEGDCMTSIAMTSMGDFVYMHNPSEPEEMIVCEVVNGGCKWGSLRNVAVNERTRMQRMVVSCADVRMEDLQRAVSENRRFAAKGNKGMRLA